MDIDRTPATGLISRIGFALLFAAAGLTIVVVFSPYRPMLPWTEDLIGRIVLITVLLLCALTARKSKRFNNYWQVLFGLFVMAFAVSCVWYLSSFLLDSMLLNTNTPPGFALLKLTECIVVVFLVILFTKVSGSSLGSIYIQKGHLKKSITIGLIAFCIAAAASVPISTLFFGAQDLSFTKIVSWLPWILIFILANATNEELLYRGLFLRKLEPLYGKLFSNLIIVLVFTALHVGVTYSLDQLIFLVLIVPLAFFWGYITQKTDTLLGSVLFHAGMDISIILGIFSNLPNS